MQSVPNEAVHVIEEEEEKGEDEEGETDRNVSNPTREERIVVTTSLETDEYTPSKTMRLLCLVQMYNEIHTQLIQESYREMIWNITKARRTLQSRASHSAVLHLPMIHASSIHPNQSLRAQRRLYPEISQEEVEADAASPVDDDVFAWSVQVCDEHGGRRDVPPPRLMDEEETSHRTEEEEEEYRDLSDRTGLRQRHVRVARPATHNVDSGTVKAANNIEEEEEEELHFNTTSAMLPQDDPLQLLLLCSNGLFTKKAIPPSLQQAQENAIRLLQTAGRLRKIQSGIAKLMVRK
jgi:hypothetical protein